MVTISQWLIVDPSVDKYIVGGINSECGTFQSSVFQVIAHWQRILYRQA